MKKMMFNDRYGLTQAVIEGRKTMTRHLVKPEPEDCSGFHKVMPAMCDWKDEPMSLIFDAHNNAAYCQYCGYGIDAFAKFKFKPKYKVGEVVAVAQSYRILGYDNKEFTWAHDEAHYHRDRAAGYANKIFVRADRMPHQIRITNIRCERLQEISDEDCMREGLREEYRNMGLGNCSGEFRCGFYWEDSRGCQKEYFTRNPKEAFSALIDKVSGRGTWERNPWVVVYEFKLVR